MHASQAKPVGKVYQKTTRLFVGVAIYTSASDRVVRVLKLAET